VQRNSAGPMIPQPNSSELKNATEELKKYKQPDTDKIPAEMIQEKGKTTYFEIHELISSNSRKDE
jgi:hypothetical protein